MKDQANESYLFQSQQQTKLVWIHEQQLQQAIGGKVAYMLPVAPHPFLKIGSTS